MGRGVEVFANEGMGRNEIRGWLRFTPAGLNGGGGVAGGKATGAIVTGGMATGAMVTDGIVTSGMVTG